MSGARAALGVTVLTLVPAALFGAQDAPRIADNSFLVEEAYNQEAGVVQHISTLLAAGQARGTLLYGFTQEWPLAGQRHQLSYSVPVRFGGEFGTGLGDLMAHYRLQVGLGPAIVAAPRVTVALPTGTWERELGYGSPGFQLALPVSARVSRQLVMHVNGSVAVTPAARAAGGVRRRLAAWIGAASIVGPVMLPVNAMLEVVAASTAEVDAVGAVERTTDVIASPGVRFAVDMGGVQVVPGVAVPLRLTGQRGADVFLYLSIEHAFRSTPASRSGPAGEP